MGRRMRQCPHCDELFTPHPSVCDRQKHCSKPGCQRARKSANNAAFARSNPDYWKGSYQVKRTRGWRQAHPGYWRNEKRNGGPGRGGVVRRVPISGSALQAEHVSKAIDSQLVPLHLEVSALQAAADWQLSVIRGLACHLTGCALQAQLGSVLDDWYAKGSRLNMMSRAYAPPGNAELAEEKQSCNEWFIQSNTELSSRSAGGPAAGSRGDDLPAKPP